MLLWLGKYFNTMGVNIRDAFAKEYSKLIGRTVRNVIVDDSQNTISENIYGLEFTDGTTVWILRDPEGNGPGFLEII